MTDNKTKPTKSSVAAFVDALKDPAQRADAKAVLKLMRSATGEKPRMWGPSIVGFGISHYKYDSGREGETLLVGFSPRKTAIVLYGLKESSGSEPLLAKLGKYASGKGCVYVKKLADVDQKIAARPDCQSSRTMN